MKSNIKLILLFCSSICFVNSSLAQEKPIGAWNSFLPYNSGMGVTTDGKSLFVLSKQAFFIYNRLTDQSFETFSKANGMSDLGMQCVGYDEATSTLVLIYTNGNIDLFKNNIFYNIPDLKIKSITGTKSVNSIYIENGMAYLSTSLGVIVIDLVNQVVSETIQFINNNQTVPINGFIGLGNYFYVINQYGLLRAAKNDPALQNYQVWQKLDSTNSYQSISVLNNKLFVSSYSNIFVMNNDTLDKIYTSSNVIRRLDIGYNNIFISEQRAGTFFNGVVRKMDTSFQIADTLKVDYVPTQVVQLMDSTIWVTDTINGLGVWANKKFNAYIPPGPNDFSTFDIYAYNKNLWIAHGGFDDRWVALNKGTGISNYNYNSNTWKYYYEWSYTPFWDTILDFVSIVRDETNGITYAGSFGGYLEGGLVQLKDDGTFQNYKWNLFDTSTNSNGIQIIGQTFDNNSNLWVATYGSTHEMNVRENSTGNWYKYKVNFPRTIPYASGPVVVDDYGQAWWVSSFKDGGVIGYNTNGTLSNTADDTSIQLLSGVGNGNLPSSYARSIMKDLSGDIWIGTDNGIAILYQPSTCILDHCDATIPIVQYDQYAGYLFAGEQVWAMTVDGANRKWIGTDNGIWLLSPDASKIIYRFTKDNSPLPSNRISKIVVDKATGDVYFGTDQGIVSFRGNATEGGDTNHNVLLFPNPVNASYTGQIAIKGLVTNADVRITDISGQLVYHTTANGGEAIWNGMDYKGHRPQSGVYLVFVTNTDNSQTGTTGSQTYVGKLVFLQ